MYEIINSNILDFRTDKKYHAIISDCPYGLAFMGKSWDKFKKPIDYQHWVTEWSSHLMQYLYPGAVCMFFGGTRTYHRLASGLEDAGYEIFDSMIWTYANGFPKSYAIGKHIGDEKWKGYGTALKPAYEPIVLCRKPLDKGGYVKSVLDYGTSGLNINGGRIELNPNDNNDKRLGGNGQWNIQREQSKDTVSLPPMIMSSHNLGRFPANFGLICTCEKEPCECVESELDNQSFKMGIHSAGSKRDAIRQANKTGMFNMSGDGNRLGDSGGASRFFYTAKASSKERELGLSELPKKFLATMNDGIGIREHNESEPTAFRHNNHPTVKPIKLIEYLATLLLPPIDNSSILIPFSGVGSEMIGAHLAGWQNITGIEIDEHYCEIANKRLEHWTQFDSYSEAIQGNIRNTIEKSENIDKQLILL